MSQVGKSHPGKRERDAEGPEIRAHGDALDDKKVSVARVGGAREREQGFTSGASTWVTEQDWLSCERLGFLDDFQQRRERT